MDRIIQANTDYHIRQETFEGSQHIVVPVVMMVEGVHSGSHGPLFHSIEELGRHPGSWDGIPVVIDHPERGGVNISANSPEVLQAESVGRIFNTHVNGDKLKAEVWINVSRISQISSVALGAIRQGHPLDVSIGVFTDDVSEEGEWHDEHYDAVATNHRPDHLALLPGGTGACSWEAGCGIRNNMKGNNMEIEKLKTLEAKAKELILEGFPISLQNNEQGFVELRQTIQQKLDRMDTDTRIHYLEELYNDYFVYRVNLRNSEEPSPILYRRGYSVDENGVVEFAEQPTQVRREVNYINVNKLKRIKLKGGTMETNDKKPCCPDKVKSLIANVATKWAEEDSDWLLTQNEETIAKFFPVEETTQIQANAEVEVQYEGPEFEEAVQGYLKKNPKLLQTDESAEVKAQREYGIKLFKEKKEEYVKRILDNSEEGVWDKEELGNMEMDVLEKLSKTVKTPVDYSLQGAGGDVNPDIKINKDTVLAPTGVELED